MLCAYASGTETPLAISLLPGSPSCPEEAKLSQRLTQACLSCRVVGMVFPSGCVVMLDKVTWRSHLRQEGPTDGSRIVVTGFIVIFTITTTTIAVTTPCVTTVTTVTMATTIWSQRTQRCLSQGLGADLGLGGQASSCSGQPWWYSCSELKPGGRRHLAYTSGKWSPVLGREMRLEKGSEAK